MEVAMTQDDPHAGLPPEVRTLLEQMDATLASIPAEHQERIVRELLAEANRKTEGLLQTKRQTQRFPGEKRLQNPELTRPIEEEDKSE
jgi:hypothetical protein